MEDSKCEECERLWKQYAEAIRTHVRLEYKLKGVALEGDLEEIQSIAGEVDNADNVRSACREAISSHEMKAHRQRTSV